MDKRIYKNTLVLYARTLVTMLIALYTSRVILDVLGMEDYGVYNLVAGIVLIFQSVSSTISGATQRYITYSIGEGGLHHIRQVFTTSYRIHLILGVIVILFGEILGLWFVNSGLKIPEGREFAANVAYQGALLVFAIDILILAYGALVVAYERMTAYAYIYIVQAILRLINVFILQCVGMDKLILYAILELCVSVVVCVIFHLYCKHNFNTFRFVRVRGLGLIKEIGKFAGWNFLGASANVFYEQGANILLNQFFSIVLNAARGITGQVSRAVNVFVANFTIALNPQITKSYAAGDYSKTRDLVLSGSKLSVYMTLFAAFPLLLNAQYILSLWLKEVPDFSVSFVSLAIICAVFDSYLKPLHCVLFASGNISKYQVFVSIVSLARLPILWMCFYIGMAPEWLYFLILIYTLTHQFILLAILNHRDIILIGDYIRSVIMPSMSVLAICSFFIILIGKHDCSIYKLFLETVFSLAGLVIVIYTIGTSSVERDSIKRAVVNVIAKVNRK